MVKLNDPGLELTLDTYVSTCATGLTTDYRSSGDMIILSFTWTVTGDAGQLLQRDGNGLRVLLVRAGQFVQVEFADDGERNVRRCTSRRFTLWRPDYAKCSYGVQPCWRRVPCVTATAVLRCASGPGVSLVVVACYIRVCHIQCMFLNIGLQYSNHTNDGLMSVIPIDNMHTTGLV